MDDIAFVEVPLLMHDKEEELPPSILQPCSKLKQCSLERFWNSPQDTKSPSKSDIPVRKRKFHSDEKENSNISRKKSEAAEKRSTGADDCLKATEAITGAGTASVHTMTQGLAGDSKVTESVYPSSSLKRRKRSQRGDLETEMNKKYKDVSRIVEDEDMSSDSATPQKILGLDSLQDKKSCWDTSVTSLEPSESTPELVLDRNRVGLLLRSPPKRATRKQKRVQLKQLFSSPDCQHQQASPNDTSDSEKSAIMDPLPARITAQLSKTVEVSKNVNSKSREVHVEESLMPEESMSGSQNALGMSQNQNRTALRHVARGMQKAKQKSVKFLLSTTTETEHAWVDGRRIAAPPEPIQEWREINLNTISPMDLIGRSCKVYWPLDNRWYSGAIHEYNPASGKHRIDYVDSQMEWLLLTKERVQFQMGLEEENALRSANFCETNNRKPDADELMLLAHDMESCEEQIGHGTVVWAKVKGWPMWPALVMDEEHAAKCGLDLSSRKSSFAVQFFGSCDFARLNSEKVIVFAKGVLLKYHVKCKRPAFEQGLKEVERYLKEGRLPEKMGQMLELQSRSKNESNKDSETSDAEDFIGDEREHPTKTSVANLPQCPLDLGGLRILSLGNIVADSEHFHNKHYIWPEGYTSVRQFVSLKDPEKMVDYRMEVARCASPPSLPLFRVVPADFEPFEERTAGECWRRIYEKLDKLKQKNGESELKRHCRKSGLSMFGFTNPRVFKLIQGLPNARACSNFMGWDKMHLSKFGENLPAGYKPIDVQWKHLERCSVCYMEEEYADNLLLQCARCRVMVHMTCYGEQESPNGGLWLCQLCQQDAPKKNPPCCLCPIIGGAMKRTTDSRWAHLTCAMWIPETCLVDVKKMEPVDGLSSIHKERWKLLCCICKVSYGACIQCAHQHCRVAYHPLCARAAGFAMEVQEDATNLGTNVDGSERPLHLLSYCHKHNLMRGEDKDVESPGQSNVFPEHSEHFVQERSSGCSRCEAYNPKSRRRRQEPEARALAAAKRLFVENTPYVTGFKRTSCRWRLERSDKVYRSICETKSFRRQGLLTDASTRNPNEAVLSMSERLERMCTSLHKRLTFGKSAIHGWGIFAKYVHQAGDMVVEYTGEILRPNVADIRERRHYDFLVGPGTYMFCIDEERVVDATRAGSIAHLINHSCEPNCYSRIITADGKDRIVIFAKRDILAGEELTYDYRFTSKGEELICNCGARGCRGTVRRADESESEASRILVPRSSLVKWEG